VRAHADVGFVALLDAYRHSGGLVRADEASQLLERHHGPESTPLARWIAQRSVIYFDWQDEDWLPWFQFSCAGAQPPAAVRAVLVEINPVFDAWEVAQWFVRPNSALGDYLPLDILGEDPAAVLQAARRDRYMAKG
jgi:hypothetical protein